MTYQIIRSSSKGNAVVYHDIIMVDCGVPFSWIKQVVDKLQIILLTHGHGDHLNIRTLKKVIEVNPKIRVACGEWLVDKLDFVPNLDVLKLDRWYSYGVLKVCANELIHDVPNCAWHIHYKGYKILHATDTKSLENLEAEAYDLYALEANYDELIAMDAIQEARNNGQISRAERSIETHVSIQESKQFYLKRADIMKSSYVPLHQSSEFGRGTD